MPRDKQFGFTALEVAVTLAIIAVLATVSMPSFLTWLQGHRLRGAAINLVADLEMAKIRAMREGNFVSIRVAADSYSIFLDDGSGGGVAGDMIQNGAERVLQFRPLPAGVSVYLSDLTLANQRMRFNSRGLAPDAVATELIPLVNTTGRKDLRINRLGNIRMQ
jgi:prepilin-type N-terminal cleavage/methylation domain-containing protein